ncbi:MAG: GNAT family N-acetyltransferase [Chloroflexi bacterium]|nr:GNAT family N-acetyltransferase [Chloroflexota bacterium]
MITGNKVILREKRLADAKDDYTWEADHELAHLDAAPPVTSPFSQYLSDYADELNHFLKTSRQFAVDTLDGKHIGNCSYYNINETKGEAELGIMIGDRNYWDKGYGTDTVTTMVDYIFRQTKLSRIYLKTLQTNDRAQKCFQKCGFIPSDHLVKSRFKFVFMEIRRDQWLTQQAKS